MEKFDRDLNLIRAALLIAMGEAESVEWFDAWMQLFQRITPQSVRDAAYHAHATEIGYFMRLGTTEE